MSEFFDAEAWRQAVADSMTGLATRFIDFLPTLAAVLAILLVGWGVSRLASAIAGRALRRMGLDRTAEKLRITEGLVRARVKLMPSQIVARLIWWMLMLTFLLSALETLGLSAVTVTVDRLVAYLPNIAAALLIVVLGSLLGRFLQNLVRSAGLVANIAQAEQLGSATRAVVVVLACVLALEQLSVETAILVAAVTTLLATLGITFGVMFALGARPLVTHILAGHALRRTLAEGRKVEIDGRSGVVESVGAVDTLFRDGDRRWSMSNGTLLEQVIVR